MIPGVLGRDVRWLVETWARRTPDAPFLVWAPHDLPSTTWTRGEFARDVDAFARGLWAAGLRPGDRFALVLPNSPDFLVAWSAVTSLGAVAVCLNPRLSRDELAYALGHSGSAMALTTLERADDVSVAAPDARILTDLSLASSQLPPVTSVVVWSDPASIQYTSGTTARPKAVVWSQANCLWAGQLGAAHQGLEPHDVNLVHLPLFHTNALSYSFLASLWSGGTVVLQPGFSASRFWDTAVTHGATWTSVVSFCLRALAGREVPARHAFRGWGSSAVVDASPATGGVPVIGWFGMTETVSHPIVSDRLHPGRAGSMGRTSAAYGVRVVDPSGQSCEPGQTGELLVRGERGVSLFAGYWRAPELTAEAFDDGWFRTGDRVRYDPDGSLWFVERDKDVLKVGGENIGAPEIERVLLGAQGVREAVVVGRPDEMLGEVPVAFVLADASYSASAARARCEDLLTDFKRPREIRVVDELPRSTLDKVAKAVLREQLVEEVAADA